MAVELRWIVPAGTTTKRLQFRQSITLRGKTTRGVAGLEYERTTWSEWEDVPVVTEEDANEDERQ